MFWCFFGVANLIQMSMTSNKKVH